MPGVQAIPLDHVTEKQYGPSCTSEVTHTCPWHQGRAYCTVCINLKSCSFGTDSVESSKAVSLGLGLFFEMILVL